MILERGIPGPEDVVRRLHASLQRRFWYFFLDLLVLMPIRAIWRRVHARSLRMAHQRGKAVTVRMARRARPQDSWVSGRFTAGTTTRWRVAKEGDWVGIGPMVAERLVGTAGAGGAVVFSLRDGAEVSVNALHARLVRTALGGSAEAGGITEAAGIAGIAGGTDSGGNAAAVLE